MEREDIKVQAELEAAREQILESGTLDDEACDRFWDAYIDAQRYGF